jgi:peptide/nickel transport system permease protein
VNALARKLAFYLLAALIAITIDFFIPRMVPGNAVAAQLANLHGTITPATLKGLYEEFGLSGHQSAWDQYVHYWGQLLRGDLGTSTSFYPTPVSSVIGGGIYWTLGLVGIATMISFALGTALGTVVAWRRGSVLDNLLPALTFFQAAPYFFLAILLVALLGNGLHWFPVLGGYSITATPAWNLGYLNDVLDHAFLPALTIVLASAAGWTIGMRNVMVTTMDEDYVLMAQAKGLPKRRVLSYAARNAILPSVTGFSLAIGFVVSGALLTEIVFSYPGIGYLLEQAVLNHDYPLLQGLFLIITFAVLAANLIGDFVYVFLDPRARREA